MYTLTVETVGQEREPVVLADGNLVRCGWCRLLLRDGDTVWAFDDVPVGSSPGSVCCTGCMLSLSHPELTARGRLRLVGVGR